MSTSITDYIVYGKSKENENFSFGCGRNPNFQSVSNNFNSTPITPKKEQIYVIKDKNNNIYQLKFDNDCIYKKDKSNIKDLQLLLNKNITVFGVFYDYNNGYGYREVKEGILELVEGLEDESYDYKILGIDF